MHPTALITTLVNIASVAATTSHIFKNCNPNERRYIESQLKRTMDVLTYANAVRFDKTLSKETNVEYHDRILSTDTTPDEMDQISSSHTQQSERFLVKFR